jgi:hypothetical protein
MNTPIEALEAQLPVRVVHYAVPARAQAAAAHRGAMASCARSSF